MKRVFIGMGEIAGYYTNLAIGLRETGYKVSEFFLLDHKFQYQKESSEPLIFTIPKYFLNKFYNEKNKILKLLYYAPYLFFYNIFFMWVILRYDCFIFGYGNSIFRNNKDLFWLKLFKKKIIANIAHGSEARPAYINGAFANPDGSFLSGKQLSNITIEIKNKNALVEKYSDHIIAAPLTCHFLTKPFINHFDIGLPFRERKFYNDMPNSSNKVRVLHSPSKPHAKGTKQIREAINNLKNSNIEFEYIEIINQPNSKVIEELQLCDFVIDQVYSDTPLAGFANEAAFYGKPAVVGGYGWETMKSLLNNDNFPPSAICHPEDLESTIQHLILDASYRKDLGKKAQIFVNSNWEIEAVGKKYSLIIQNKIPEHWYIDPFEIQYVNGVAISNVNAKYLIKEVLRSGGEDALCLNHKEALKQSLIKFANS